MLRLCVGLLIALIYGLAPAAAQSCGDQYGRFISNALSVHVESKRAEIEQTVRQELGRGDRFARGITLYNINFRMGETDFQFANNEILYTINGNYLYFKSTTPTVLGSYGDPAFEVHFDLEMRGPVTAPLDRAPYTDWMAARISTMTVKPRNVSGDIVTTIVKIFSLTGTGAATIQQVVDAYLMRDVTAVVNAHLKRETAGIAFMSTTKTGSVTSFRNPMYDCGGAPAAVDVCRSWASECGEPAAQEFCRRQGFNHAIDFRTTTGRSPTWVPVSQRLCLGDNCGSFAEISCSNSAKLGVADIVKSGPSTVVGAQPVERSQVTPKSGTSVGGALGKPGRTNSAAVRDLPVASPQASAAPDMSCKPGFVWREARADDLICVPPDSRAQIASENAAAASRTDPNGAWGPATCLPGYVWREAFEGDVTCVTPDRRAAVKAENAAAASRRASGQ